MFMAFAYDQVAGAQEEHHAKDVDHAGGEDAVPGAEQHRLPHKHLDLPPGLAGPWTPLVSHHHGNTYNG